MNNQNEARQSIGICPQHNVLFDSLTVSEHLAFFMRIKGITPERSKVQSHAEEIGLGDYLCTTSSALSGGNKRKLSVAIALSGDPRVLVLDEPTSAMDPHSRRAVWELLRSKRKGRVTVLTTHFMDEAELLSDRVAVMKEGKLRCCGSPLFLKERFGLGYNLTVVLEPIGLSADVEIGGLEEADDSDGGKSFDLQIDRVAAFLTQRIPGTTIARSSGKEVSFRFPQGTESLFPATFDDLEREMDTLGIGAYGIQNSSLEEVFLQLAEEESSMEHIDDGTDSSNMSSRGLSGTETRTPQEQHQLDETTEGSYSHLSPIQQIGLLYGKRWGFLHDYSTGACDSLGAFDTDGRTSLRWTGDRS